ncbi:MAG: hypothetical protein PHO27_13510, partial [Sulfuricurvum sp.]|nr:hypothetical protein [Sulfuricurvum sp.]
TSLTEINLVQASIATSLSEINLVQASLSTIVSEIDLTQATLSTVISEIDLVQASLSTIVSGKIAEMAQGLPTSTPTLIEATNYLYRKFRNKQETTATDNKIYDDAGVTVLFQETHSDDGTTFTKGKYVSG